MSFVDAIILGVIEGITEFLPISSTGHMIVANRFLGLAETEFLKSFEIAIQLGAILAVVVLYWRKLLCDRAVITRIAVAFVPTAVLGFLAYPFIKRVLLGNVAVVLGSLFLGGIFLVVFELLHREKEGAKGTVSDMTIKQAFVVGLCQSVAFIPGISRSAATIVGGLVLNITRKTIVEFSFLLAVPTMGAAVALDLLKSAGTFSRDHLALLAVGFITAFIVALFAIRFLVAFIQKNNFIPFGVYRIIFAVFCLLTLMR